MGASTTHMPLISVRSQCGVVLIPVGLGLDVLGNVRRRDTGAPGALATGALRQGSAVVERTAEVAEEVPSSPCRPVAALALTLRIALDDQLFAACRLGLTGLVDEVQKGFHSFGIGHGEKGPARLCR